MDVPTFTGALLGEHAASIRDLGILTHVDGDTLMGTAEIAEEMFLPGTARVRTSVLATMADVVCGKFANAATQPRICVTLDLDVHLVRSPRGTDFEPGDEVRCRSHVIRSGRRITVMGFELEAADEVFGFGHAGFMASPDPAHLNPDGFPLVSDGPRSSLDRPFAECAGIRIDAAGRAVLPYQLENVNATGALQGGLLVLAAEEALRAGNDRAAMTSVAVRYLRAFRQVDAVAHAEVIGDVGRIELRDATDDRLGTTIVAHVAAPTDRT